MISFEPLWKTMKKKPLADKTHQRIQNQHRPVGQDCAKTGMSAPTPSTSSASVLLGAGRQKKGDPLVYALVTKDGVERY